MHGGVVPPRAPDRSRLHARRVSAHLRPRGGALHLAAPGQYGAPRYEDLLRAEIAARRPGELGWSAEWRKDALGAMTSPAARGAGASIAARVFAIPPRGCTAGCKRHQEFTLAAAGAAAASLVLRVLGQPDFVDIIESGTNSVLRTPLPPRFCHRAARCVLLRGLQLRSALR